MECYPVSLYSSDTTSVSKTSIGEGKHKIKKGMAISNEKKLDGFLFRNFESVLIPIKKAQFHFCESRYLAIP